MILIIFMLYDQIAKWWKLYKYCCCLL